MSKTGQTFMISMTRPYIYVTVWSLGEKGVLPSCHPNTVQYLPLTVHTMLCTEIRKIVASNVYNICRTVSLTWVDRRFFF